MPRLPASLSASPHAAVMHAVQTADRFLQLLSDSKTFCHDNLFDGWIGWEELKREEMLR